MRPFDAPFQFYQALNTKPSRFVSQSLDDYANGILSHAGVTSCATDRIPYKDRTPYTDRTPYRRHQVRDSAQRAAN